MPTVSADHTYYIDLTDDPGFATFTSHYPENLEFNDKIKGPGDCTWQISFSAKDQDGATVVTPVTAPYYTPFIGPYRDYFRLRYGNVAIMAGPIISTDVKNGQEFVSVSGKTWEHYFERWQYPFDPRVTPHDSVDHTQDYKFARAFNGNESTPSARPLTFALADGETGVAYECYSRDIVKIIADVLGMTMYNVPYRHTFDISSLSSGLSGIHASLSISLGDTTYMDAFINNLVEIGQGMDWWISWDQRLLWASPYRFGDPGAPTIAYTVDSTTPMLDGGLGLQNNGPAATHVFGQGAGHAAQTKMGRTYGYAPGQAQFSRLDKSYDFGDMRNFDTLRDRTQKQLSLDLQPQHQIPLQLDPALIPNFWSTFRKGRAIWITYNLVSNRIDSLQQIVSYSAKDENNSGNVLVDLTLEQRYDLDWSVGTPEG